MSAEAAAAKSAETEAPDAAAIDAAVERLSALDDIKYQKCRETEAAALRIAATKLDKLRTAFKQTEKQARQKARAERVKSQQSKPATDANGYISFGPYDSGPDGVFYDDGASERQWLCNPLRIEGETNDNGKSWGLLISWFDPLSNFHRWAMPRRILAGDGTAAREKLIDEGFKVSAGRKNAERLSNYLMQVACGKYVQCVSKAGWTADAGAYVTPLKIYQADDISPVFSSLRATMFPGLKSRGRWRHGPI